MASAGGNNQIDYSQGANPQMGGQGVGENEHGAGVVPPPVPQGVGETKDELQSQNAATGMDGQGTHDMGYRGFDRSGAPQLEPPGTNNRSRQTDVTTGESNRKLTVNDFMDKGIYNSEYQGLLNTVDPDIAAAIRAAEDLPIKDRPPEVLAMMEFLKAVASFLTISRQIVQHIAQAEAASFDQLQDQHKAKLENFLDNIEKQKKLIKKMRKMKKLMKILGPVITAVMALVAVLLTVLTAGTMGPAMIAVTIAVTVAMTALTVADQAAGGFMTKGINSACKAMMDGLSKAMGDPAGKIFGAVLIVLVVVLMCVATKGAGSSTVATTVGQQVARTAVVNAATQLITTALMASDALMVIFEEIALACGASKEDAKIIAMGMQALVVCLIAIGMGYAAAKMPADMADDVVRASAQIMQTIGAGLQAGVSIAVGSVDMTVNLKKAEIAREKGDVDAMIEELQNGILKALGISKEQLMAQMDSLFEAAQQITGMIDKLIGQMSETTGNITGALAG